MIHSPNQDNISIKTLAELTAESSYSFQKEYAKIRQRVARGYYPTYFKIQGEGHVSLSDPKLPDSLKFKLTNKQCTQSAAADQSAEIAQIESKPIKELIADPMFKLAYENEPKYNRIKADKYISILTQCENLKGQKLHRFVFEWNTNNPEFTTSYKSIKRILKQVQTEGAVSLLAGYGKNAGKTTVDDLWYDYFYKLFMDQNKRSSKSCWTSTLGYAFQINSKLKFDEFPSESAFMRRLKSENPDSVICLKREGPATYNKRYANYVERDYSNLYPGQVWVSDHRQLDAATIAKVEDKNFREDLDNWFSKFPHAFYQDNRSRKPIYPWITVWRDFLTGRWLGWSLHLEDPNTDFVLEAFYNAFLNVGSRVPEAVIIDNGKDYRAKDFAGGRVRRVKVKVDEIKVRSLCAQLNIESIFTWPYNAQAKPIERDFLDFKNWADKSFPGYRGGNVVERPEKLIKEIKSGNIIEFGQYSNLIDFFIEEILNKKISNGKVLQMRSRNQAWNEELEYMVENGIQSKMRNVDVDDMKLFMMRTSIDKPIGRNGVCLSEKNRLYYYGTWMEGRKGRYVYMRRSNKRYQIAYVFDSKDDAYLGKAVLNAWVASAYAQTDLEKKDLSQILLMKKQADNIAKALGDTDLQIDVYDILKNMSLGEKIASGGEDHKIKNISPKAAKVFVLSKASEHKRQIERDGTYDIDAAPLSSNDDEVRTWI